VPDHDKSFMEKNNYSKIPNRSVKQHGKDLYYRGQKCRDVWQDDNIRAMKWWED
jgi:hypothetical protein